jgi:hypothetical protein
MPHGRNLASSRPYYRAACSDAERHVALAEVANDAEGNVTLEEAIEHYFAKGQHDYVNGEYDPPLGKGPLSDIGASDYQLACQRAYRAGWKHAKSQDC